MAIVSVYVLQRQVMNLYELLDVVSSSGCGVCADSRLVGAGDVFVAVRGINFDGHDFIKEALAAGAGYIVCEKGCNSDNAEIITVTDSAHSLALLAQAGCGNPSAELTNLAVTGTNGKTTVTFLVRSIIEAAGKKCGLLGTIGTDTADGGGSAVSAMTTPDAVEISRMSRRMVAAGAEFMVIEASSHALQQKRLAGIDFAAAAFTNLTGDHLDYHGTMEEYLAAKMKLFENLSSEATAVLNAQDAASEKIAGNTKAKTLFYAVNYRADITADIESMDINGTVFTIEFNGQKQKIKTSLIGLHNISNHLAAAGLCLAVGFDIKVVAAGLEKFDKVPGRLEPVGCGKDFTILVDYAHTDDALKNVLKTLRPLCRAKLIVVFGCGGDRDRTKRPRMAEVAEQLADMIIVTSDNPRTEDADKIIEDIKTGFSASANVYVEPDRKKAIGSALLRARRGDIVLIAGKGHEDYQITGNERIYFSDIEVVREFLK